MIPATAVQNPLSEHQEMLQLKSVCSGYNIPTLTKSIEIPPKCQLHHQQSNTKIRTTITAGQCQNKHPNKRIIP